MIEFHFDNAIIQYDHAPDVCPICGRTGAPKLISGAIVQTYNGTRRNGEGRIDLAFQCASDRCNRLFIGRYTSTLPGNSYYLECALPYEPQAANIPDDLARLSPEYALIFNQASKAEQYGLKQVCGAGYRKALEFLVKDFCIKQHPDKEDEIKDMFLGSVIKKFTPEGPIRQCAELASWLGNDECHYERRWQDKDLQDLKNLLRITARWILNFLETEQYIRDMSPPNNES